MTRTRVRELSSYPSSQMGLQNAHAYRMVRNVFPLGSPETLLDDFGWQVVPIHPSNRGRQVTVDENHGARYSRRLGGVAGDVGGPFNMSRQWISWLSAGNYHVQDIWRTFGSVQTQANYIGPVLAIDPGAALMPSLSLLSLGPIGTTAIARCKPTNSIAALFTTLVEFYRDGVPSLFGRTFWKERTRAAHGAGGEYLNSEFGWKPLANDVRNAVYGVTHANTVLTQYERDSGKTVRRHYEFPEEVTETVTDLGLREGFVLSPINLNPDTSKPMPRLYKRTTTIKRRWFSGAFTYHLPTDWNSRNRMKEAMAKAGPLLGIELTPETVWNAAPWTWAIDWFSNLGDVISNLSDLATDGLVLKYGYVMEYQFSRHTYFLHGPTRFRPYGFIWASPVSFCVESKRREKATPFGFGLNFSDFSPRQWAIVTALGLSRR